MTSFDLFAWVCVCTISATEITQDLAACEDDMAAQNHVIRKSRRRMKDITNVRLVVTVHVCVARRLWHL
jgi:hypothetical protein